MPSTSTTLADQPVHPVRFILAPIAVSLCGTAIAMTFFHALPSVPGNPMAARPTVVLIGAVAICLYGLFHIYPTDPHLGTGIIAVGLLNATLTLEALPAVTYPADSLGWFIIALLALVLSLVLYLTPRSPDNPEEA